jgi:hypothetical protein
MGESAVSDFCELCPGSTLLTPNPSLRALRKVTWRSPLPVHGAAHHSRVNDQWKALLCQVAV